MGRCRVSNGSSRSTARVALTLSVCAALIAGAVAWWLQLDVARGFFTPLAEHTRRALADIPDEDLVAAHRTFTAVIEAMRGFRDELDAMSG